MTTVATRIGFWALLLAPTLALAAPVEDHWSVEADPATTEALTEATRLIEAEAFDAARPILERLAGRDPANADVFNLLGFAYRKTGRLGVAASAYERALYLDPRHVGALEYQGELFLMQGDLAAAEANLARLDAVCPSPCEERDELAEAIEAFRAAAPD